MTDQPQDLQGWVTFLSDVEIPVLRHTARELARLQEDEDKLSARAIAGIVLQDPLMMVRLLRYQQAHRRQSQLHELVQIEQTLMMMGLNTFFRALPPQPLVEDVLREQRVALLHLLHTVRRAQRAARWAFDWALLLHDLHAEEVRVAALLSYMSEMLMWCFDTPAMLKIHTMQDADKTLRSAEAQQQVLGFVGMDLQRELITAWQMPELFQHMMDPAYAGNTRVRNVIYAINLARHSSNGWDNAALPDDYRDIGELLRMEPEKVMAMVGAEQPEADQQTG